MDSDTNRNSGHFPTESPIVSGVNSMAATYPCSTLHHFDMDYSRARSDYARSESNHRFEGPFLRDMYQDQTMTPMHIQHNIPGSTYTTMYPNLNTDDVSQMQSSQLHENSRTSGTFVTSILPSMPNLAVYDSVSPFHPRHSEPVESANDSGSVRMHSIPRKSSNPYDNEAASVYTTSGPIPITLEQSPYIRARSTHIVPASTNQFLAPGLLEERQHDAQSPSGDYRQSQLQHIDQQIRSVFDELVADRVIAASKILQDITRLLLSSAMNLGLHLDDEDLYESRMSLWQEFNHCWEALAQKQRNVVEEEHRTRRNVGDKLSIQTIHSLISELILLCDRIEELGLVDYEMGVWEEQIVAAFISCLDLMEQTTDT